MTPLPCNGSLNTIHSPQTNLPKGQLLCVNAKKSHLKNLNDLLQKTRSVLTGAISPPHPCEAESGYNMACYYPLEGWRSKIRNPSGKYPIVFQADNAQLDEPLKIPCGKCIGCRLERSRQTAMRCVHEASLYEDNCFITLTYNEESLPENKSLTRRHFQLFMKKFRKKIHPIKLRYYMCGEYGKNSDLTTTDTIGRPHYHAIIFNYDFTDKVIYSDINDKLLYTSETLEKLWGKGFCTIGSANFETAAYVARYIMKKINGDEAEAHYQLTDPITGEITNIHPEFTSGSNQPGIGHDWFIKYKDDLRKDFITMNGIKMKPPKYYDKLFKRYDEANDEDTFMYIQEKRSNTIDNLDLENSYNRLRVKEKIKLKKIKQLTRELN